MKIPYRFPIGIKLALVSIVILLGAMVPSAFKTSSIFKNVSGKREEDSNRSQAESRSSEVTVILDKISEKISFYGPFLLADGNAQKGGPPSFVEATFARDPDIISIEVRSLQQQDNKQNNKLINTEYLKGYKLAASYLGRVDKEIPVDIGAAFDGEVVVQNRSLAKGAPLLTISLPLVKDKIGKVSHVGIANVRLNRIQKAFSNKSERIVYLVDKKGNVFAHPDEKLAMTGANLKKLEIVQRATASHVSLGQLRYYNKDLKEFYISAFAKTPNGLTVVSEAPESIVLEPAAYVQRQVFFTTCIALSISLFVVFLMSLTITRPINRLVLITKDIARGNFNIPVAKTVAVNDEVGTLATSFDAMLAGLRERDKVKKLFSKFHGSSVADSLLSTEQVGTGGKRKSVVIFFSDIRGFTAISENTAAEHVVSMVNEYFAIMVGIILANQGIVDKFIGDAIMAVWGSPQTTGDDCFHAVKACIEMRQALAVLNTKRMDRGESPMMIGMGLHTGEAISGNIGSEERMEFTVIGDTVNMTSRIEASTKAFGTDLLISDEVAKRVKGRFVLQGAGKAKVKGKAEPLALFRVAGTIAADGQEAIVKTPYSEYEAEHAEKVEIV